MAAALPGSRSNDASDPDRTDYDPDLFGSGAEKDSIAGGASAQSAIPSTFAHLVLKRAFLTDQNAFVPRVTSTQCGGFHDQVSAAPPTSSPAMGRPQDITVRRYSAQSCRCSPRSYGPRTHFSPTDQRTTHADLDHDAAHEIGMTNFVFRGHPKLLHRRHKRCHQIGHQVNNVDGRGSRGNDRLEPQ